MKGIIEMTWNLFLDDERFPPNDGREWVIARNHDEVVHLIANVYGTIPSYVSFDHDLGGEDISVKFIWWMIDAYLDERITSFTTQYYVHSQNPIGAANIRSLMDGFIHSEVK